MSQSKTKFDLWMDWRPNRIKLKEKFDLRTDLICDMIGMSEEDFQVKGKEIRFSNKSNMAFFRMNTDE
jgi:hypothetical protein|tara:strand:- start:940 stop:1143 length:204 start_codon:yes stop_codon:yes gene_type:complete